MPSDARMQDSNPFVEIATHLFLEDLAGKVGVAGLNNYLVSFAPVHREVAEYYNHKVQPTAVTSVHIVLHTFRQAAAARIRVGDDAVRYEPVAAAWVDGTVQLPEGPKLESLLKRAGITRTKLGMLLRNHSDVWLLEPV